MEDDEEDEEEQPDESRDKTMNWKFTFLLTLYEMISISYYKDDYKNDFIRSTFPWL